MQTFKKNQIIITALVILIAVAGYLNFSDRGTDNAAEALNQKKEQTEENDVATGALVSNSEKANDTNVEANDAAEDGKEAAETSKEDTKGDTEAEKTASDATSEDKTSEDAKETTNNETDTSVGEAIFTSKSNVEAGYFLRAKINREQGYAMLKEGYLSLIENKNLKEEQKTKAVQEMLDLHDRIEKEAATESLLEAKGFKDVFVRMMEGKVDVVINAKELSQAEMAQIEDIVRRQTGIEPENIVISLLDTSKTSK